METGDSFRERIEEVQKQKIMNFIFLLLTVVLFSGILMLLFDKGAVMVAEHMVKV